jgi:hypothetical protein
MMMRTIVIFLILFIGAYVKAQSPLRVAEKIHIPSATSGVALAATDANMDGLDDIIRFQNGRQLELWTQRADGTFHLYYKDFNDVNLYWNVLAVNLNDDPWIDVIASSQREVTLWLSQGSSYERIVIDDSGFFPQAANMADLNQDGLLDLFVCNDRDTNFIFIQTPNGFVKASSDLIDYGYNDPLDFAGNYGSVWLDLDNNGSSEGYIAKCFQTATLPTDNRRINQLLMLNDSGVYENVAQAWNVNDSAQSWASTFADIDNDGDFDLFVLNHDAPSRLYRNKSQSFDRIEEFKNGTLNFIGVQAIAQDFNHNGFIDFFLSGNESKALMNDSSASFRIFDLETVSSAVSLDIDNDGDIDIYGARHGLYNNPGRIPDQTLINSLDTGHFIRIQVLDSGLTLAQESFVLTLHSDTASMSRHFRFGDSYGICQTNALHFGLGKDQIIDSLSVKWEDGQEQVFVQIEKNQSYYFEKGGRLHSFVKPQLSLPSICEGDTTFLTIPGNLEEVQLFTDSGELEFVAHPIAIWEEGHYYFTGRDTLGNLIRSEPFFVAVNPAPSLSLNLSGTIERCVKDPIEVFTSEPTFLEWNNGIETPYFMPDESGTYYAIFQGLCDTFFSDTLNLTLLDTLSFEVMNDTLQPGDTARLEVKGGAAQWFDSFDADQPIFVGNVFTIPNVQTDTSLYVSVDTAYTADVIEMGPGEHLGGNAYHNNFFSGALNFKVHQACILEKVSVQTDDSAFRVIELLQDGIPLESDTFEILQGVTELELNWVLEEGSGYEIRTNTNFNLETYGIFSPRLYRDRDDRIIYPYTDGNYITITSGNGGANEYFYFYNWRVRPPEIVCATERKRIQAVIQDTTSAEKTVTTPIYVYPNPNRGQLYIQHENVQELQIYIVDPLGRLVYEKKAPQQPLQIQHLPKGHYWIIVQDRTQRYYTQLLLLND